MALARLTKPPRIETLGALPVSFLRETEGSLHKPISLQAGGESGVAARAGSQTQRFRTRSLAASISTVGGAKHAPQRKLLIERIQLQPLES